MLAGIIKIFKAPTWHPYDAGSKKTVVLASGISVAALLILLEPFSINNTAASLLFMCCMCGYGILASVVLLLLEFAVKPKLHYLNNEQLPLYRIVLWYSATALIMSAVNCGYYSFLQFIFNGNRSFHFPDKSWAEFLKRTFLISLFLVTGLVLYFRLALRYKKLKHEIIVSNGIIHFPAERGNDFLRIPVAALLYIEAKGNYVQVQYSEEGQTKQRLIRSSLKKIESGIHAGSLMRCHKAYIINIRKIKRLYNSSSGAGAELYGHDKSIPVSRIYLAALRKRLEASN
jgi:preprotein translocase subunit SecG